MASSSRPILARIEAAATPRQLPALPDEILEEILLWASPTTLGRASAACTAFRRWIAGGSFLRRYRSRHPPLLLGFVDGEFRPAEAPHPCAAAVGAFAEAADFSFDGYVPLPRDGPSAGWATCDVRDGRVLVQYGPWIKRDRSFSIIPDLAVCDPLSRRYRLLPPMADALLASIQVSAKSIKCFDAFIVPSGEEQDEEAETAFRVMGFAQCLEKLAVFIFSSDTGSWSVTASITWEALRLTVPQHGRTLGYGPGYFAYGCFYKAVSEKNKLLKFDVSTTEFSIVNLPPQHDMKEVFIVEAGGGRLGVFSQISWQKFGYAIWQNGGQKSGEWKTVNVPLPMDYLFFVAGAFGGYIFLSGQQRGQAIDPACFSIEIETLTINRVGRMIGFHVFPYFGYPPSMSPRRI